MGRAGKLKQLRKELRINTKEKYLEGLEAKKKIIAQIDMEGNVTDVEKVEKTFINKDAKFRFYKRMKKLI